MNGPPPVVIEYLVKGLDDTLRSMKTISEVVSQTERRSTNAARAGTSERQRTASREVSDKIAAWRRADAAVATAQRAGAAEAKRQFQAESRAAAQLASERIRMAQKVANEERKLRTEALKASMLGAPSTGIAKRVSILDAAKGKSPTEQHAALGKVADLTAEARIHDKVARDKIAAMKRADRETDNARKQGAREADRLARDDVRRTATTEREKNAVAAKWVRQREAEERDSARRREAFAKTVVGAGGKAIRNTGSIVGGAAKGIMNAGLNIGGGFSVEESLKREVALRGQAATLAASSQGGFTSDQLLSKAKEIGGANAIDPSDVMRSFDEVKKLSGDMGMAMSITPKLAKLASATGADLGELGGLAGNIVAANPNISQDDLYKQTRIFAQQGIVGGVEIGDFAKYGGRITAGAGLFGGKKEDNEVVLGGMAQIARQRGGASSAAEATLAAQRFATDVQKHSGDLKKQGIDVTDGKGTLRNAEDISIDMLRKSGGDVTKLTKMGLGERGVRVLTGVADIYREAGGGEAGEKAVRKEYAKYKDVMSEDDVEKRSKQRLSEVDAQLEMEMQKLKNTVASELLPQVVKFTHLLRELTPTVGRLLRGLVELSEWASNHPFAGMAALVTASLMKELVAAKIGDVINNAIRGGSPGGVPGGTGAGATSLIGAGAAVQVASAADLADERTGASKAGKDEAAKLTGQLKSGDPAQVAEAQKRMAEAQGQASSTNVAGAHLDTITRAANIAFNPIGYLGTKLGDKAVEGMGMKSTAQRSVEALKANEIVNAPELKSEIAKAVTEGVKLGMANGAPSRPTVPSGPNAIPTSGLR